MIKCAFTPKTYRYQTFCLLFPTVIKPVLVNSMSRVTALTQRGQVCLQFMNKLKQLQESRHLCDLIFELRVGDTSIISFIYLILLCLVSYEIVCVCVCDIHIYRYRYRYEPVLKVRHKNGTVQAESKYERSIKLLIFLSSAWYWLLKFVYRKIVSAVVFLNLPIVFRYFSILNATEDKVFCSLSLLVSGPNIWFETFRN